MVEHSSEILASEQKASTWMELCFLFVHTVEPFLKDHPCFKNKTMFFSQNPSIDISALNWAPTKENCTMACYEASDSLNENCFHSNAKDKNCWARVQTSGV